MTTIDIVLLVIIGLGGVWGFNIGFFKELASILGLIAGLLIALALYNVVAERLSPSLVESMTLAQIIAFVAIWVVVPLILSLVASAVTRLLEAISLGWVNRLLGFALGVVKYVILIGLFANVLDYIDTNHTIIGKTIKENSSLYYPIRDFVGSFFPTAKEMTEQYILI